MSRTNPGCITTVKLLNKIAITSKLCCISMQWRTQYFGIREEPWGGGQIFTPHPDIHSVELCMPQTLTFDLLTPKPNQFIFAPSCTTDKNDTTLCLKKTSPFYFCDIFVRFHPIFLIFGRNIPPGNLKQTHIFFQFISHFICWYCIL